MKKLLFSLIVCTFIFSNYTECFAKKPVRRELMKDVPVGTNTILVESLDTTKLDAFKTVCNFLLDFNVEINKADKELWLITTMPIIYEGSSVKLMIRIIERNNKIWLIVSGLANHNIKVSISTNSLIGLTVTDSSGFERIEKKGQRKSRAWLSFHYMWSFADNIPHKTIIYETR